MKQAKTKTDTLHDQHPIVCEDCSETAVIAQEVHQTANDFRSAVLVVSVMANVFVLTAWLVTQV